MSKTIQQVRDEKQQAKRDKDLAMQDRTTKLLEAMGIACELGKPPYVILDDYYIVRLTYYDASPNFKWQADDNWVGKPILSWEFSEKDPGDALNALLNVCDLMDARKPARPGKGAFLQDLHAAAMPKPATVWVNLAAADIMGETSTGKSVWLPSRAKEFGLQDNSQGFIPFIPEKLPPPAPNTIYLVRASRPEAAMREDVMATSTWLIRGYRCVYILADENDIMDETYYSSWSDAIKALRQDQETDKYWSAIIEFKAAI